MEFENVDGKHVYGGTFVALLKYIPEKKGKRGLESLFKKMVDNGYSGPTAIKDYKLKIRYELKDYLIFMHTVDSMFGPEATNEMSRYAPKRKGIVGWFVRWAGTPNMLVKKAKEYWPQFYDYGTLDGDIIEEGKGILTGKSICISPILCRAHTWYYKGAFESIGLKNVNGVHTKCECKGDEFGEWTMAWE